MNEEIKMLKRHNECLTKHRELDAGLIRILTATNVFSALIVCVLLFG